MIHICGINQHLSVEACNPCTDLLMNSGDHKRCSTLDLVTVRTYMTFSLTVRVEMSLYLLTYLLTNQKLLVG